MWRELDTIMFRESGKVVTLYQMLGRSWDEVDEDMKLSITQYNDAFVQYQAGQFEEALEGFQRVIYNTVCTERPRGDKASLEMASRCKKMIAFPPSAWEGTWLVD